MQLYINLTQSFNRKLILLVHHRPHEKPTVCPKQKIAPDTGARHPQRHPCRAADPDAGAGGFSFGRGAEAVGNAGPHPDGIDQSGEQVNPSHYPFAPHPHDPFRFGAG